MENQKMAVPRIEGNPLRTGIVRALCLAVFILPLAIALTGAIAEGRPEVNVNVGINVAPPPPLVVSAPPSVVLIPGTYIYFAPGLSADILFYQGFWYRSHGGGWFRARSYNGPWAFVHGKRVPRAVVMLPPDYRHVPPGHRRIPYGQLKKNWSKWERDRHWDRHDRRNVRYDRDNHGRGRGDARGPERRDWDRDERGRGHGHSR